MKTLLLATLILISMNLQASPFSGYSGSSVNNTTYVPPVIDDNGRVVSAGHTVIVTTPVTTNTETIIITSKESTTMFVKPKGLSSTNRIINQIPFFMKRGNNVLSLNLNRTTQGSGFMLTFIKGI